MSRPAFIHRPVFVSLTLTCIAAAWWGCTATSSMSTTEATSTTTTSTTTTTSATSGTGGGVNFDGGGGGGDAGACVATSAVAQHFPLDIVFLIDQSGSMEEPSGSGTKWSGITAALTSFCNDPASDGIGAGLVFLPDMPWDCNPVNYESLVVPIGVLPGNAFAITNAMPAMALGVGTPMYGALEGALMAATAHQDANPTHKVILVFATDGDPNANDCDDSIADIAGLASSALNYDGVQTFVIGCVGSTITNLDQIAAGGGTTAAYDVTTSIDLFAAKIAQIRTTALGCNFQIPPPPGGKALDPNDVNFSYTPGGTNMPTTLLRATDLAGCNGQPGWYYDSNTAPTEIILCPASCTTVQDDSNAKVNALFGCTSEFM
jgi:hypothetical protein